MKLNHTLRAAAACFAALLLPFAGLPAGTAFAEESSEELEKVTKVCGDYVYSVLYDASDTSHKAACIEDYTGKDTEVVIPAELDGLDVVLLGDAAFVSMRELTGITLPKTLERLGQYTFAECTSITHYEVEDGNKVFESRDGVLYADGGETLMRYPVGKRPTEYKIEEGVTEIGPVAFACSNTLTTVTLPESLVIIGQSAFAECSALTEIEIPEKVTEIPAFTFNHCSSLTKVTMHDNISEIGDGAFAGTKIETVTIPSKCITIGQQAFADTPLKEVFIPASVQEIGYSAFGWQLSQSLNELIPVKDFIIYGTPNSAAEEYAGDTDAGNSFTFRVKEAETTSSATETSGAAETTTTTAAAQESEKEESNSKLVKIIGLSGCGVLVLLIGFFAIRSGKKKKPADSQENTAKTEEKNEPAADASEPEAAGKEDANDANKA